MDSLRKEFIGYIQEYLTENEASEFEKYIWEKFDKKNIDNKDLCEELYKIQMKSYLLGLKNKTFDYKMVKEPHIIHDVHKKRWKIFDDLKQHQKDMEKKQIATTDLFQCNRCKERKCIYHTAQTRSADESATIYVECTNCGLRWKQ